MNPYPCIIFVLFAIGFAVVYWQVRSERTARALAKLRASKAPEPLLDLPLSCFVKGLIASLETEPGAWGYEREKATDWGGPYHIYRKGGAILVLTPGFVDVAGRCSYSVGIREPYTPFNRTEQRDLTAALVKVYEDQLATKQAAKDAEDATIRAPFEALGCPKTP